MAEGFSNPVANAAGTLIRGVMKSLNYVLNVAGWQISRNGDAEFNNGSFRGIVRVVASNGSEIDIDPSNINPQIIFYSPDHTNNAYINAVSGGNPGAADLGMNSGVYTPGDGVPRRARVYMNDSNDFSEFAIIRENNQHDKGGSVSLTSISSYVGYRDQDAGFWQFVFCSNAPEITVSHSMNLLSETWHLMTLLNSWVNVGGFEVSAQYRKVAAPCNCVQIVGEIRNGTTTAGTIIATLPAGYRPAHITLFPIASNPQPASGGPPPMLRVDLNGDISVFGASTILYFNAIFAMDTH